MVYSAELLGATGGQQHKVIVSLDSRDISDVKTTLEQSLNTRLSQQDEQYSAVFLIDGVENRLTLFQLEQHIFTVQGPLDVVSQIVDTFALKGGQ